MLRDPYSFEDLIMEDNCIVNASNGVAYKIEKEIIRFIKDSKIDGNNKKYLNFYDRIAPFYNIANKLYFILKFGGESNYRKEFLSELEIRDNDKVIEISVGTADNFPFLPRNIELYGLDISFGMLKQAKRHLNKWGINAQLFQGVGESLPFKNEVFDVVYHVGGINFFNDKGKAINEMIRIAKSGTKIVIVDETEKLLNETYKKNPITRKHYSNEQDISAPIELIPKDMIDIKYKEVCKGLMYCLSFRKP